MEIHRLYKDELIYECSIQCWKNTEVTNARVADWRAKLRELLDLQKEGQELEDLLLPINVEEDKFLLG